MLETFGVKRQGGPMLHTKWIVRSLLVLISSANFVAAANESYVVSFIAAPLGLGLVHIQQTETLTQPGVPSIYPVGKTLGSTAIDTYMDYWDYGASHYVWVINGEAEKNLSLDLIKFGDDLQPYDFFSSPKILGGYYPLHLF